MKIAKKSTLSLVVLLLALSTPASSQEPPTFEVDSSEYASVLSKYLGNMRMFKLRFFEKKVTPEEYQRFVDSGFWTHIQPEGKYFDVEFWFEKDATSCRMEDLKHFRMLLDRDKAPFDTEGIKWDGLTAFGSVGQIKGENQFKEFTCDFEQGTPVRISFVWLTTLQPPNGTYNVHWSIDASGTLDWVYEATR